jgi:hypothetical protein
MATAVHHLGFTLPQFPVEFLLHPVDGGIEVILPGLGK